VVLNWLCENLPLCTTNCYYSHVFDNLLGAPNFLFFLNLKICIYIYRKPIRSQFFSIKIKIKMDERYVEISKGIPCVCLLEVSFLGFHCELTKSFWLVNSQCGFYQITKFDISYVHSK
jgi:hypothetical protein